MKKLSIEILIILIAALVFGFLYNYFSKDPLPIIYKAKEIQTVSDSSFEELLSPLEKDYEFNQNELDIKIENPSKELDSIKKEILDQMKEAEPPLPKEKEKKELELEVKEGEDIAKKENKELKGNVTFELLKKYVNDPRVLLIDSREPELFQISRIGNAINIYPYLDKDEYFRLLLNVPEGKTIIVYCEGGECDLSHLVANDLINLGYKNVLLYLGGFDEWEKRYKG